MTATTIRTLESALTAALIANDAQAVGAFFAEDWVYVTPTGPVSRAEILGAIADGRLQHFSFETIGAERLVVQGDMAIWTSHEISTGAWAGTPYRTDEWITDIWLRQSDGNWLCVMSQKTDAEG
jgi:ketosteroid isomerase-like protein